MPRLTDINQNYRHIMLFEALPVGGANGSGALQWDSWDDTNGAYTNRVADIATCRARGQKIIMSIGGATGDMNFTSRTKSQTCIDSIKSLSDALGGIDGIDWDNYENVTPVTAEYVWMGQQLKSASYFGANFTIQSAVGPWRASELTSFFTSLFSGGALDYVMPMMYADSAFTQDFILNDATEGIGAWATAIGGYPRLLIGFGIDDTDPTNYMTEAEILSTWNAAEIAHPTIGGAVCWNIYNDIHQTSGTANSIATQVMAAVLDTGAIGGAVAKAGMQITVPAYSDYSLPQPNEWTQWADGQPAQMIVNYNDGPGTTTDSATANLITYARNKGVQVLGYVLTGYGARTGSLVDTDVSRWKTLYGVTDIFLDEVDDTTTQVSYYTTRVTYVHNLTAGSFVMINPGTETIEQYITSVNADCICTFEDTASAYSTYTPAAWHSSYSPTRFCHLITNCSTAAAMRTAVTQATGKNVNYIYITSDDINTNPWDQVPTYWTNEAISDP